MISKGIILSDARELHGCISPIRHRGEGDFVEWLKREHGAMEVSKQSHDYLERKGQDGRAVPQPFRPVRHFAVTLL